MPATPVLTGLVATSMDDDEPMHERTAAEIGAMLSAGDDLGAYESDSERDDDVLQDEDDVMEDEIDDAAEEGPYGLVMPGDDRLEPGANENAQDAEDIMIDDADNEDD